jgi:hypothetical protein
VVDPATVETTHFLEGVGGGVGVGSLDFLLHAAKKRTRPRYKTVNLMIRMGFFIMEQINMKLKIIKKAEIKYWPVCGAGI